MRIATVDVGTNTALLLIAEITDAGDIRPLLEEERFVRLGEGIDASGIVREEAVQRLCVVLKAFRDLAAQYQADPVLVAGTSASRDARNREALIEVVRREVGLGYEVLSGEEEARWSFAGAVSGLNVLEGPCSVIDIGGGSTEITIGRVDGGLQHCYSLDVGSVRITERFFAAQPPARADVHRATVLIREMFEAKQIRIDGNVPFVGTAGTLVTLAALHDESFLRNLPGTPSLTISHREVRAWSRRLLGMTRDEVLALNPSVMEGRADVFPAGVLILDVVMRRFDLPSVRVSARGLRHGLALRYMWSGRS